MSPPTRVLAEYRIAKPPEDKRIVWVLDFEAMTVNKRFYVRQTYQDQGVLWVCKQDARTMTAEQVRIYTRPSKQEAIQALLAHCDGKMAVLTKQRRQLVAQLCLSRQDRAQA